VLCDVVGAATVYKIVKKKHITLYRKYLIIKYIYTEHRIDNKGTQSVPE